MKILLSIGMLLFAVSATFEASLIWQISEQNKAQQKALVCFDYAGKPTLSDHWQECREVAIRELHKY